MVSRSIPTGPRLRRLRQLLNLRRFGPNSIMSTELIVTLVVLGEDSLRLVLSLCAVPVPRL